MSTSNDDNQVKKHLAEAIDSYNKNNRPNCRKELRSAAGYNLNQRKFLLKCKKNPLNIFTTDPVKASAILTELQSLQDITWNDTFINEFEKAINKIDEQNHKDIKDQCLTQWRILQAQQQAKKCCSRGIQLSENSEFDDAFKEFEQAISCASNYYEAYFEWGKALLKNGNQEEAIKKSLKVFEVDKSKVPQMIEDLKALQNLKWDKELICEFEKAIEKIDEQNHKDIKDQALTQWKDLLTQQARKHFDNATKFFIDGNFESAFQEFAAAVSCGHNYDEAYFKWGKALIIINAQQGEINKFINAFEASPSQITNTFKSLQSSQDLRWDKESISKFQQAINNYNPDDKKNKAKIYHQWGVLLSQLKLSDKSIKQQKESVDLDHDMEGNWKSWSREIAKNNFPNEHVQEYEQALEKHQKSADAYTEWAHLFRCQSRFEEAASLYKKAIFLYKKPTEYEKIMGLYKTTECEKALKENQTCQRAHEWLLYCLLKIHDLTIKEEAYKLLEYLPENKYAYNRLIFTANLEREFEEAIKIAKKASEKEIDWWRIKINWARALYENGQNDEAIKIYEALLKNTSTIDKPDQALIYYFYGNLLLDLKRYEEAGKKFDEAIKLDLDCVYAYHNLASIPFEIQGQYEEASTKWDEALTVYERLHETALTRAVDQEKEVDSHEFYYHAQILQAIKGDKEEAEKVLKKGLDFNPEDTLILSGLASLEWEKKGECLKAGTENAKEKSACHWRAMDYFKKAEKLLKERLYPLDCLDHVGIYDDLIELANLYFIVDNYEESRKYYQKATDKNEKAGLPHAKLGIIQLRLKKPKAAIPLLKKSLELNPDELDVRSSLAEAYLRAEKLEEADQYYREVLDIAPNHVQSLIGLGETCTDWGDKKETDRYLEAIDFFKEALKIAENERMRSKYLTTPEKAKINYLLGYTTVQRYENSKLHHQYSELKEALKYFKKCKELNPSYQKVARAIDKLKKSLSIASPQRITEVWGTSIIFGLSLLIFILVQGFFYIQPSINKPYWSISESSLKSIDKKLPKVRGLESFKDKQFPSGEAESIFIELGLTNDNNLSSEKKTAVTDLIKSSTTKNSGGSVLDTTSYSALTFGLLLFMVVALYLPQILKLSVAGISLEKSTLDQSQTGGSMGIAK